MRRHFPATTVIPDSAIFLIAALMVLLGLRALAAAEAPAGGWIPLFDGKTLMGWKASENPASFTIEDGCIVAHGPRAHLFSVGDVQGGDFKNFDLQAEVNAGKNSNSGIYFHTAYQKRVSQQWPSAPPPKRPTAGRAAAARWQRTLSGRKANGSPGLGRAHSLIRREQDGVTVPGL